MRRKRSLDDAKTSEKILSPVSILLPAGGVQFDGREGLLFRQSDTEAGRCERVRPLLISVPIPCLRGLGRGGRISG